ncbi:MAG: hypothetical protein BWX79_03124 [Alphaproteobacteria bacterium ADurb.Bin100]|nr:MAG: hypothetical protein BWX79_03124 [Alphaproteobacteria bacterium ADurb.Bin100]
MGRLGHAVDPGTQVPARRHQFARRPGVPPEVPVHAADEAKVAQRGTFTEQEAVLREMGVQQVEHVPHPGIHQRELPGPNAHRMQHAAKFPGHDLDCAPLSEARQERQQGAAGFTLEQGIVLRIGPACVHGHRDPPLIAPGFHQVRGKALHRCGRMDRAVRDAGFNVIDDPAGVVDPLALGRDHDRHHGGARLALDAPHQREHVHGLVLERRLLVAQVTQGLAGEIRQMPAVQRVGSAHDRISGLTPACSTGCRGNVRKRDAAISTARRARRPPACAARSGSRFRARPEPPGRRRETSRSWA